MAYDFGRTLGAGVGPGLTGAGFGPWGALAGFAGGAGADILSQIFGSGGQGSSGAMGEFFGGKPAGIVSANRFSPDQISRMQQLGNFGLQGLSDPYQGFTPIRDEALNQYRTNIIPTILERFSASGDNALSSPSLGSQLSAGANDFSRSLAAMQSQYGLQNRGQLLDMLGLSLSPQYDNYPAAAQSGLLQQILPSLGMIGAKTAGNYFGGQGGKEAFANALKALFS